MTEVGDATVSTVFLGIDMAYASKQPVYWGTMVFRDMDGSEQDRCSGSREQAEAMHEQMVNRIKAKSTTPT